MLTRVKESVARRRWTRSEYYKMAELGVFGPDDRLELIGGEIIHMCPQKRPHAMSVSLAATALRAIFEPDHHVQTQSPLALGLDSDPEPDVAVVAGRERDYPEHPTTAVLVVEVSDTTLRYDRYRKASLYAQAGIPDYWLLNLPRRQLEVRREPVPMPDRPFGYGYRVVRRFNASDHVSPLAAPASHVLVADLLP